MSTLRLNHLFRLAAIVWAAIVWAAFVWAAFVGAALVATSAAAQRPVPVNDDVLVALEKMAAWAARVGGVPGPDANFIARERARLMQELPQSKPSTVTAIVSAPRTFPVFLEIYGRSRPVYQQALIKSIRIIYAKAPPPTGAAAVAENLSGLAEEWSRTGGPPAADRERAQIMSRYGVPGRQFGGGAGGSVLPNSMSPGCMNPLQRPEDRNTTSYCQGFRGVPNINGGINGH